MHGLTDTTAWHPLSRHYAEISPVTMRELFSADPSRFAKFSLTQDDLLLDYSKNRVTEETLSLLLDLARESDVEGWRAKMFAGAHINSTEDPSGQRECWRQQVDCSVVAERDGGGFQLFQAGRMKARVYGD